MKLLDNITTLTPERKAVIAAQWAGTFADLKLLTRVGIALLRGTACPIEETAMARMCNPAKTKALSKDQRGFLAFQGTLDRAANFLKDCDPKGLSSAYATFADAIPRDALIDAKVFDAMVGQTMLSNAYDTIQHARTVFILCKEKYGDTLTHIGTKNLTGAPRKVTKAKDIQMSQQIRDMFKNDPDRLGLEATKYILDPAAYVLPTPEVAEPVTLQFPVSMSASAAT